MKQRNIFILLLVFISFFLLSACSKPKPKAEEKYSAALIAAPDAINVSYLKNSGADQITYDVKVDYPATGLIEDIKSKLEKQGWKPLKDDFLNPGISSSMERGWSDFDDATRGPEISVKQWITDWNNSNGDIVRYVLRYEYPKSKEKNLSNLKIAAVYIPVAATKNIDKQLSDLRQKYTEDEQKRIKDDIKSRGTGSIKESIKVYLAESSPANGLKEVPNSSSNQKLYIPRDPVITSNDIANLKTNYMSDGTEFRLDLNAEGTKKLHTVTKDNIGKRMVIYYNDEFCNAPVIREAIDTGSFMAFKPKPN